MYKHSFVSGDSWFWLYGSSIRDNFMNSFDSGLDTDTRKPRKKKHTEINTRIPQVHTEIKTNGEQNRVRLPKINFKQHPPGSVPKRSVGACHFNVGESFQDNGTKDQKWL